nr:PfkB family carbohydrate kinase [Microbacterium sp. NIBRBAC000506063]
MPEPEPSEVLCIGETMAMVTPVTGEPLRTAEEFHIASGGAECNVARHLARLGHRTAWASALGADALGSASSIRCAPTASTSHGCASTPSVRPGCT